MVKRNLSGKYKQKHVDPATQSITNFKSLNMIDNSNEQDKFHIFVKDLETINLLI